MLCFGSTPPNQPLTPLPPTIGKRRIDEVASEDSPFLQPLSFTPPTCTSQTTPPPPQPPSPPWVKDYFPGGCLQSSPTPHPPVILYFSLERAKRDIAKPPFSSPAPPLHVSAKRLPWDPVVTNVPPICPSRFRSRFEIMLFLSTSEPPLRCGLILKYPSERVSPLLLSPFQLPSSEHGCC